MLKRRTVLQGALAGALLTGCSSGTTNNGPTVSAENPFGVSGDVPLEVVVSEEYGELGAAAYRKKYEKAAVTTTPTKQLRDLLQSRFAAGSPPDVVLSTGDKALTVSRLVAEDQLADLQSLLEAPSWGNAGMKVQDGLLPGMLEGGRYEGTLRAMNYIVNVYGLWYSAQLFQKYGWDVPRTWPELLALGTEMKAAWVGPFIYAGVHPYYVFEAVLTLAAKTGGHDVVRRIDNLEDGAWKDQNVTRAINGFGELARRGLLAAGTSELDHLGSQTRLMTSKAGLLPLAKPGLISVGIFNVLGQWNQFVLPSFLSPEKPVLSQGIASLLGSQRYENDWGTLFAALTIAMLPVVVVYLIFYRQVQAGLTSSTLK